MKRNKNSSQQTLSPTHLESDIPNECWESIFKFVINDDNDKTYNRNILNTLSVVSKQFLYITYRLRFSLNVYNPIQLRRLLIEKYTNLTSLNFSEYYNYHTDLNSVLRRISRFPLKLTSLNLSNQPTIPANGLRAFSKNITTLTTLICSNMYSINATDLFVIAECLPLLEELELNYKTSYENYKTSYVDGVEAISNALCKLRKVNLSDSLLNDQSLCCLLKNCKLLQEVFIKFNCDGIRTITNQGIASSLRERTTLTSLSLSTTNYNLVYINSVDFINSLVSLKSLTCLDLKRMQISNQLLCSIAMEGLPLTTLVLQFCTGYCYVGIFTLLNKCQKIQHLDLQNAKFLNDQHVVDFSLLLGDLVSINLSHCSKISKSALFSIAENCHLLNEIKMESIGSEIVENSDESSMELGVHPQLKSLHLCDNSWLSDESIIMIASMFPNLELLDLRSCDRISKGICQILKRCCNIRHLNLAKCSRLKLVGMDFLVPKLEVLDLSFTKVNDKSLSAISKNCRGLLQLSLKHCVNVTEKGLERVEENCTHLMPSWLATTKADLIYNF